MRQPGMLVLLADGPAENAVGELLRAGHLGVDGALLDAALAQGGTAAVVAQRLATQCDVVVGRGSSALASLLRELRRPGYPSVGLVPVAHPVALEALMHWSDIRLLLAASRALDR